MRIVMIEPDAEGGLFHFAYQLCRAIGATGHETYLITANNPEIHGDSEDGFRLLPVMRLWSRREVMSARQQSSRTTAALLATRRVYRGLKLTFAWLKVLYLARRLKPDVIIVSMILHSHIQAIVRRLTPKNVILAQICHEFVDRESLKGDTAAVAPLVKRFDRVFFLSEAARQDFITATGFEPGKGTRIPHGSQDALITGQGGQNRIRTKLGLGPDVPVLLFFGVLRRSKGLEDLIGAFAASEACRNSKLVIAGRATKYIKIGEIENRITDLGIEDRVVLHNAYIDNEDISGFFEMARAVALPYRTASASGVLHLAYTCERAVIATSVGGLAEDVIDGQTGILVPPNDPPALANAIDQIMADPELAATMGRNGKLLSNETHSWENVAGIVTQTLSSDLAAVGDSQSRLPSSTTAS